MNFGQALEGLKLGQRMHRAGWNGKGIWIALQRPDANSKMRLPYLYISNVRGELVPYTVNQSDVLADDWAKVELCGATVAPRLLEPGTRNDPCVLDRGHGGNHWDGAEGQWPQWQGEGSKAPATEQPAGG